MHNNQNPFFSIREQKASYNSIKRNRVFRSQKKFTQGTQHQQPHRETLKTEFIALIESAPKNDTIVIQNCIDELKQKLLQINVSAKRRSTKPLQQYSILKRKSSEQNNARVRAKTNIQEKSQRTGSKSLNFVRESKSMGKHKLANFQDLRNQIKRNKQLSSQKRLSTQKQLYRYDNFQQIYQTDDKQQGGKKRQKNRSTPKFRSMTQQVVRSCNNPARMYHHQSQKKSKAISNRLQGFQTTKTHQMVYPLGQLIDNNSISKDSPLRSKKENSNKKNLSPAIIDNNEKIGDISTIMAQKQTLNFLGDSCVGIKQGLSPQKRDIGSSPKKRDLDSSKILDFVGWKTAELKNVFLNPKQQKRKQGLDRLSKVFPKGFFN